MYVGDDLETYLAAARHSREQNITIFDEPVEKMVCVMQGDEFVSTWVANKAIYRTRMALADGGELLIIAPGLKRFGEQPDVDRAHSPLRLLRHAARAGAISQEADMQDLAHATAHLIHGSTEGRFTVTYAPGHLDARGNRKRRFSICRPRRNPRTAISPTAAEGWNTLADGERFFFIPTPSAGLWATREKIHNRPTGFGD